MFTFLLCFYICISYNIYTGSFTWSGVIVADFVFTFLLWFIVLTITTVKNMNHSRDIFGITIGFSVVVGGYAIGPISGAEPLLVQKYLLTSTKVQILTGKCVCRRQFEPACILGYRHLLRHGKWRVP